MTSLPTPTGFMTRAASRSLPITDEMSTSIPRPSSIEAMINTARPLPLVGACVAPMATTTKRTLGHRSAASRVRSRNGSTARTATASWALAIG
jgi:hypothetical protein